MTERDEARVFQMRGLPAWWARFAQYCRSRHIPMRTVILWLVSKFLSDRKLQEEYVQWLVGEKKEASGGS